MCARQAKRCEGDAAAAHYPTPVPWMATTVWREERARLLQQKEAKQSEAQTMYNVLVRKLLSRKFFNFALFGFYEPRLFHSFKRHAS